MSSSARATTPAAVLDRLRPDVWVTSRGDDEGILSRWAFFSRRLRMWLLLAIALPLTRALVHRLALAAERRDPSTRTAKALHQADSTVTAVSRRTARKAERRKAGR
jgi:hypothetical protein